MEEVCVIFSPFSGRKRFSRKLLMTCGEGLSGSCAKELHARMMRASVKVNCLYITCACSPHRRGRANFLDPTDPRGEVGRGTSCRKVVGDFQV